LNGWHVPFKRHHPSDETPVTTPSQRKLIAEAVGTMVLVVAVIGSGIAAQRLSPGDVGLQLLENAVATGAALTALILALQPVSAAFNPIITLIEAVQGTLQRRHAAAVVAAQVWRNSGRGTRQSDVR